MEYKPQFKKSACIKNNFNELSDRELVQRLILNDSEIIKYLFYIKCSGIFGYIIKEIFNNKISKDELISELFIYLQENNWDKVRKFNYQSKFTTWLSVVTVRFFIKKRTLLIGFDSRMTQIEKIKDISNKERYDIFIDNIDLYSAINKLPNARERFVLLATEIEGRDETEIADILNMKVSNVYNIKSRGKKHLSNIIKGNNDVN